MFTTLEEIYKHCNYDIKNIVKHRHIENYIVELYNNNLKELNEIDVNKLLWNGNYHKNIEKNYDEMKKYYLMAIELNNSSAMNNLATYYQYIEINYDEMKKYCLMAIELNNSDAMNNLGYYYQNIEKNYDEMKKYYLMAIKLNNYHAIQICKKNNYFYCDKIKEAIILLIKL